MCTLGLKAADKETDPSANSPAIVTRRETSGGYVTLLWLVDVRVLWILCRAVKDNVFRPRGCSSGALLFAPEACDEMMQVSSSVRALGSEAWWVCGNILWSASSGKGFCSQWQQQRSFCKAVLLMWCLSWVLRLRTGEVCCKRTCHKRSRWYKPDYTRMLPTPANKAISGPWDLASYRFTRV